MASYAISNYDFNYIEILIDGTIQKLIKKAYLQTFISGDFLYLKHHNSEMRIGSFNKPIDYNDVTSPVVASAAALKVAIDAWLPPVGSGTVLSVTGLDTDNTDPANPVVQIAVDGATITGDGTPGSPLTGASGYTDENAQDAVGTIMTTSDDIEFTYSDATPSITARLLIRNFPPVAWGQGNPADGSTNYFSNSGSAIAAAGANLNNVYPPAGILMGVHLEMLARGTTGSGENISIYIRKNDTTDYLIATVGNTNLVRVFENLALNAGAGITFNGTTDFYCYKVTNPTWATNPAQVGYQGWTNYYIT